MKKLGFGCMRLPLTNPDDPSTVDHEKFCEMVDEFLNRGFTYFDTAYMYHNGKSEIAVREALVKRHPRDSFLLADKLPLFVIKNEGDKERIFDEQFEKCGVDYFDYYLLHNVNSSSIETANKFDCFEFIKQKKAEGKLRHIGFSYHDNAENLDKILTEHPEMEFVQIQLNYLDYETAYIQSRKCYEVIKKHGKKAWIMEPVKGGMLANPIEEVKNMLNSHLPNATPSSWAIRFAASHNEVAMVLSGMSNMEQLCDNTDNMSAFVPLTDEEKQILAKAADIINAKTAVPCTACAYCVEGCPMNIAIPEYFSIYNSAKQRGERSQNHVIYYRNYSKNRGKASDCIGCKNCESACPQHIEISKFLKDVADLMEN